MAISDALATFAAGVALNTGAAGTYVIGDQIDLGRDFELHDVDHLCFDCTVQTTATSGGSATLAIELVTADNGALTSNPVVLASSGAIAVADLVAGRRILGIDIPKGQATKRYLGIRQVTGTAAFTAGAINAFLTQTLSNYRNFPDALTSAQ